MVGTAHYFFIITGTGGWQSSMTIACYRWQPCPIAAAERGVSQALLILLSYVALCQQPAGSARLSGIAMSR